MKDKSFSEDPSALRKARRLRHKLSNACHLMPDSLRLEGVHVSNREPVYCGGFADIFKGSYEGRDVAVKRLRVTQRTQGDHSIQQVCLPALVFFQRDQYLIRTLGVGSRSACLGSSTTSICPTFSWHGFGQLPFPPPVHCDTLDE
jgi:hypothetical protein